VRLIPLDPNNLRVGLFVKLDHNWTEHPFLRNTFKIVSAKHIAIIQKCGLTRIFFDPTRSDPEAVKQLEFPSQPGEPIEEQVSAQEIEEEESNLNTEKQARIEALTTHQKNLVITERSYTEAAQQAGTAMRKIGEGSSEGLEIANQLVGSIVSLMGEGSLSISLVSAVKPAEAGNESSMQSVNVCALSMLTGQKFKFSQEEMQVLGLGALLHNLGLQKVPLRVRSKEGSRNPTEQRALELYPLYGREMAEKIPGISPAILDIIELHQERLDGSGFPQGLSNGRLGVLPRLVGVIAEYDAMTRNNNSPTFPTPTQALSHLYVRMRDKCGADVIEPFIATTTVFPPGSLVRMTDESIGLVIKTNEIERMRPLVMLYEPGIARNEAVIVDLAKDKGLSIRESLNPKTIDPDILIYLSPSGVNGYFLSPAEQ